MTLKEKILNKSNLWHLAALAFFLLVSGAYFYPAFQGYSVQQGDVKNWVGAAQEINDYRSSGELIGWTSSMFSGMPATQILGLYKGTEVYSFLFQAFQLWLPRPVSILFLLMFGFYVLCISYRVKPMVAILGAVAFGLSSYFVIIIEVGHITKALAVGFAPFLLAGMVFAYRWKNWVMGVALSCLFMSMELSANHLQVTYYLVFIMLGIGIVELINYIKQGKGIVNFLKISGGLIVAYLIAVMANYGNIKGTQDYAKYTTRGGSELTIQPGGIPKEVSNDSGLDREYITQWSYGRSETFTFIVPNYKGGKSQRLKDDKSNENAIKEADPMYRSSIKENSQYWGDQPGTSGPVYIGVIVVLLALLSLYYVKDKIKWALLAVTLLTVMLSWGKNFMGFTDFFLDFVPGYNKFRAVTIILVIAEICVPLMGVLFVQKLYDRREEIAKNLAPFYVISGGFAFILLLLGAMPTLFNSFISGPEQQMIDMASPAEQDLYGAYFGELEKVRIAIFRKDVWRSLLFLIFAAGAIFAYLKNLYNKNVFVGLLVVLVLFDLILVDSRYLNTEKAGKSYKFWVETYKQQYPYLAQDGEKQILAEELRENPWLLEKIDSATAAQKTKFTEGKYAADEKNRLLDWATFRALNRYTNFRVYEEGNPFNSTYASYFLKSVGGYHGAKLGRYQELIEFHLSQRNPAVMDMLNVKYRLRPVYDKEGQLIGSMMTGKSSTAMGNAWLSHEVKVVENADEEIMALYSANTYALKTFGAHQLLVNGNLNNGSPVSENDLIQLLFVRGIDSSGTVVSDTIPVQVPFTAVNKELPLVLLLSESGLQWDYAVNVDSTRIPLLAVYQDKREGWDPGAVTVVDKRFQDQVSQASYSGEGTVEMTSYHPSELHYRFSSPEKQLVVFSEIYFPVGWKAFVDTEEVPISRVDYVLRAVEVPAGDHEIRLVQDLEVIDQSGGYAYSALGAMILLFVGGFWFRRTKSYAENKDEEYAG